MQDIWTDDEWMKGMQKNCTLKKKRKKKEKGLRLTKEIIPYYESHPIREREQKEIGTKGKKGREKQQPLSTSL